MRLTQLALTVALSLTALSAAAQTTVPFSADNSLQKMASAVGLVKGGCSFADRKLPADTIVVAAGAYSGRKIDIPIDQSGHQTTQFDVGVHADKPVALLLAAYEPTIWNIGWTKGTNIVAVFATGYHRQAVAGLPKGTPIITSSHSEKGACGFNYMGETLEWVNPKSREVFGREAVRVYNKAPGGVIDIVEAKASKTAYITSPYAKPESFKDVTAPLAGEAGLNEAVAKGLLRKATDSDVEMVRSHYVALAAKSGGGKADIPPVAGAAANAAPAVRIPRIHPHNGYVVLKPFVFPAGLYGGHSAGFIVPKGVPTPTGNPGHSIVIDLNKANACSGPLCGM